MVVSSRGRQQGPQPEALAERMRTRYVQPARCSEGGWKGVCEGGG